MEIINTKHKFSIPETPTNKTHTAFLKTLRFVEGLTNHGLLFSTQEEIQPEEGNAEDMEYALKQ